MFAQKIACYTREKMKNWRIANIVINLDGRKKVLVEKRNYQ